MLDYVRKKANSPLVKLGAGLIALTFFIGFGILTGISRTSKVGSGVVAEVNGEKIYLDEYNLILARLVEAYRRKYGDQFNEAFMKKIHFREQVLYSLVIEKLKAQEARKLGMDVDDRTLAEYIASIPAFQYGGRFNQQAYINALRGTRPPMTPAQFEKEERQRLEADRFDNFVKYTWFIENDELYEIYYAENEKVDLYYVKFSPQQFEGKIRVSEKEAEDYYATHKDEFKTGELRKVKYVYIPFLPEQKISDEMIEKYYNEHKEEFKHGEQVKVRHILIKVAPGATTAEVEAARRKALRILKLAREGRNFAKLAEKYSEGPSASRGGDLGWFGRGEMVKPFEEASFNTKPGEVTGPVRTQFGFHIIKVEAKRGPGYSPLEEVKNKIKFEISREIYNKRKQEIDEAVKNVLQNGNLEQLATRFNAKIEETPYFDKDHIKLNDITDEKSFKDAVFQQKEMGKPFKVDGISGVYVAIIVDEKPPYQQPFPQVKDEIIQKIKLNKAKMKAAEEASRFLTLLKKEKDIEKVARKFGLKVGDTGEFNMIAQTIPGIGKSDEIKRVAFSLNEKNPIPDKVFSVDDSFVVIQLKEHKKASPADFMKARVQLEKKYREKNSEKVMEKWLKYLQEEADIQIYKEAIMPPGGQAS